LKDRLSYWLGTYWVEFDFVFMKPRLVHNWPQVKDDNDKIAQKIKDAIDDFNKKKAKENNNFQGTFPNLSEHGQEELNFSETNLNKYDQEQPYQQEMKTLETGNVDHNSSENKFNMFKDLTIKK
jgi:hypothetical protein